MPLPLTLQRLLKKIDRLQKNVDNFRPFDEDLLQTIQESLRIEWTYNSNAIEGNTLTYGETAFFLREGLTSEGKPLKDYLEAKNHAEAIDGLHEIIKEKRRLSESLIKELHSLLLHDIHFTLAKGADGRMIKKPLHPGKYKTRSNHVLTLSGKIHYYTDPLHVKDEMEKLLSWFHKSTKMHPVERASIFHYRFAAIHPFDDGNGRLARLLMNLILMKAGYYPCIIKNAHRKKYLETLEFVDTTNDYEKFIEFIANELIATPEKILRILQGEEKTEQYKRFNKDERISLILGKFSKTPLSIGQILEEFPWMKRPTLKKDLQELVRSGKIRKKGKGKGVTYFL